MKKTLSIEAKQEVLSLISGVAFANVPSWYGATRRDLKMDILAPKVRENAAPRPTLVWICGGAYMVVDRSVWVPEMQYFARRGFVVASIEYRTSNEARFPAQLEDVKAAIRYLKAHSAEYCVDPDRVFVMGESAGGSLASLAAVTGDRPEFDVGDNLHVNSRVRGAIDIYGPCVLGEEQLGAANNPDVPNWTMAAWLGAPLTMEKLARGSATTYLSADTPPFMILHGSADATVPIALSGRFYAALQEAGVPSDYLVLEGAGHGDQRFYQDEVKERILGFMRRVSE